MELIEIEQSEQLSREDAAARLHAVADQLARNNEINFERGGVQFRVHVPDDLHLKVELEVADDGTELEIELTW